MGRTTATGMSKDPDPLDTLAVGVAADHAAQRSANDTDADLAEAPGAPAAEPFDGTVARDAADLDGGVRTDGIEAAGLDAPLMLASLVGDLRDGMVMAIKQNPKPWGQMLSGAQHDVYAACEHVAKEFVRRAEMLLAAKERPSITAVFKGFKVTGEAVDGTLKFVDLSDDDRMALFHASSKSVLLVVADAQAHMGQRRGPDVAEDQEAFGFADAGDPPEAKPDLTFGVYDANEEVWLVQAEEGWDAAQSEAGRWPAARAEELAREHEAEVRKPEEA